MWTVLAERGTAFAWRGGADSADHVSSLVSLKIITEDSPPGVRRRPQRWPCTPWLAELLKERVLTQRAPPPPWWGEVSCAGCWLAARVCKSAALGAELLAFGWWHQSRQRLHGVCCHGVLPDTGRHTQTAVQSRDGGGRVGGGSVQSLRSVPSGALRWPQGRPGYSGCVVWQGAGLWKK